MHERVLKQKTPYIRNKIPLAFFSFLARPVLTYHKLNTQTFNEWSTQRQCTVLLLDIPTHLPLRRQIIPCYTKFDKVLQAFNNLIKAHMWPKCWAKRKWFTNFRAGMWVCLIDETAFKVFRRRHNGCILDLYHTRAQLRLVQDFITPQPELDVEMILHRSNSLIKAQKAPEAHGCKLQQITNLGHTDFILCCPGKRPFKQSWQVG